MCDVWQTISLSLLFQRLSNMCFSAEWKKSDLISVPPEPIGGWNIISLTSLEGFLSENEDAGNLQEKLRLYECTMCDKRFPYLYSFKDCQICTSVMNEKSFLSSNSDVTL